MAHWIPLPQGLRAALRRIGQRAGLPGAVLAVGLLLTMLSTLATAQADQQQRHQRAMQLAQDVGDALTNRLDSTVAILSATAGLFEASETVSRQEFHRFFHALNLSPETLRGIQGIGFAALVPSGTERQRFIARIRADGQPDFRIWPESNPAGGSGEGAEREPALTSAIVFIQPQEWRNRRAIGYDMYSQSTRRSAMARAALSREPMLSGPVRLVQEADNDIQVGTLVYVPISRGGIDTAEESTDTLNNLMGWAYAPMRMGDLLKTSLALVQNPDLHQSRVMLFDGIRPVQEARLADSDPDADPGAPAGTVWIQRPVLDRQWLIGVAANPVPRTLLNLQPVVLLTALAGLLASTLAALGARLVLSNQRMTLHALEKAKKASEERALAAAVFDSSPIGMIVTDPDGVVQEANVAFTQISGWSQREAVGHKANLLRSGRHDDLFYRQLWESIIQRGYWNGEIWNGEIWNRHRNGQIRRHELSITAVVNGQQQITHFIGMLQDITDRHAEQEQVRHQALHDTLTGLPNRSLLMDQLQRSLALERRRGGRVALLFMDLDGFKPVNDRHGHQLGDALLQAVASRLKREIRASDTLCRQGGDEFVLLVPGAGSDADLLLLGEKLRQAAAEPYAELADDIAITMSVGIACWPEHASDADGLLRAADAAMYAAKRCHDQHPGLAPVLRLGDSPENGDPCADPGSRNPVARAVAERPAE